MKYYFIYGADMNFYFTIVEAELDRLALVAVGAGVGLYLWHFLPTLGAVEARASDS